jgi:hypothetical protein
VTAAPRLLPLLSVAAILMAACTTATTSQPARPSDPSSTTVVLRTMGPPPGPTPDACPAALVEGVIVRIPPARVGIQSGGDAPRELIWPNAYTARVVDGRIVVLDEHGDVAVREGDRASIGGGETAPGAWLACGGITVAAP